MGGAAGRLQKKGSTLRTREGLNARFCPTGAETGRGGAASLLAVRRVVPRRCVCAAADIFRTRQDIVTRCQHPTI